MMPMYQMPPFYGRDPRGCHPPSHPSSHHDHQEGAGHHGGPFMTPFYGRGPRGCHPPPHHDHQQGAGHHGGPFMFGPHRGPRGRRCHPHRGGWSTEAESTPPTRCGPSHHIASFFVLLEEQNKRAMMEQQHANEKNEETSRSLVASRSLEAPQHVHRSESEEATTLSIDVTGFSPSDLEVRLEKHILTLHGTRKNRLGDIFVLHRQVALDVTIHNENAVEAHNDDGVLEITIAKKNTNTPVNLSIPIRAVVAEPREEKLIQEAEIVLEAQVDTPESSPAAQDDTPAANETRELQPGTASDEESVHVETVKDDVNEDDEEQSWEEVDEKK
jgi:HSP20 family molecular chaperone IbpA